MNEVELDFEQVHDEYRPRILRYLRRMVGEQEAEDVTQDVFLKISRGLHTFRGESRLSTWIYRIATNAALDRLRAPAFKRASHIATSNGSGTCEAEDEGNYADVGEETPSLDQQLFRKERYECYEDFVANLPPSYRAVVALSDLEGLVANEIAEILGLNVDLVKTRLHRGRARLVRELKLHCRAEDWL